MDSLLHFISWDNRYDGILLLNIFIAIGIFSSLRFFLGFLSHVSSSDELTKKDNPAFGVSLAAVVFGVALVLFGAIYGDPIYTYEDSAIAVGLYGVIGVVLLALSRIIFDRIAFRSFAISDAIIKGNMAAAVVDAGNVIASAIVIYAVLVWVSSNTIEGILAVLYGYVISQVLLSLAMAIRVRVFAKANPGHQAYKELERGNVALALRFTGRRIGIAFAIAATSNLMTYEHYDITVLIPAWAVVSIVIMAVLSILSYLANLIILAKVDTRKEVVKEQNIAIGAVQCSIYVCIGLLLYGLVS